MATPNHWATKTQKCWSAFYVVTWMMLLVGSLIYHIAILSLVPTLQDLPSNLKDGFYDVFKFSTLKSQSEVVKKQSSDALNKCNVTASQCSEIPEPPPDRTSETEEEKKQIDAAFASSLNPVLKICRDPYFGTSELQDTAQALEDMLDNITAVNGSNSPCIGTNILYCNIHSSANVVLDQVSGVTNQIDEFIESDMVELYNENASYLNLLHALPWITLGPAALFFFCFWWKAGKCCNGLTSCCCFLLPYTIFWLLFFVTNTIFTVLGLIVKTQQDRFELDFLQGKPTLDVFVKHVEATYPEFWNLVFKDMVDSLDFMLHAFLVYEVFAIVILFYGLCMCCWRPYKSEEAKVHDTSVKS